MHSGPFAIPAEPNGPSRDYDTMNWEVAVLPAESVTVAVNTVPNPTDEVTNVPPLVPLYNGSVTPGAVTVTDRILNPLATLVMATVNVLLAPEVGPAVIATVGGVARPITT